MNNAAVPNKQKSQTTQVIILVVVMLGLIVVAAMQFMKKPETVTVPTPTTTQPTDATATSTTTGAGTPDAKAPAKKGAISWISESRVPKMIAEVKGGRNPFNNLLEPSPIPIDKEQVPQAETPKETPKEQIRTLQFITPKQLASAMQDKGLSVRLESGDSPNSVKLSGTDPDFSDAVALMTELDTNNSGQLVDSKDPDAQLKLSGVVITRTEKYAAIVVNGTSYTFLEGESIPRLGWTVTDITPTSVTLIKGTQSKSLRLSGGSPS